MTPKQRVKRRYPTAYAYLWRTTGTWTIGDHTPGDKRGPQGFGRTAAAAWADAEKKF